MPPLVSSVQFSTRCSSQISWADERQQTEKEEVTGLFVHIENPQDSSQNLLE